MKYHVTIAPKAHRMISQCVLEADNNFEIGGVLVGYRFWKFNFVVAATVSDAGENGSKVFFLLDGVEHTEKVNEIAESGFIWPPSVLGIWHSHICDGHNFSQQDKLSNRVFAKTFGGALSMLVTQQAQTVLLSISYISDTGVEKDCTIKFQNKAKKRRRKIWTATKDAVIAYIGSIDNAL